MVLCWRRHGRAGGCQTYKKKTSEMKIGIEERGTRPGGGAANTARVQIPVNPLRNAKADRVLFFENYIRKKEKTSNQRLERETATTDTSTKKEPTRKATLDRKGTGSR